MIKTAIIVIPIITDNKNIKLNNETEVNLAELLKQGYRIKMFKDVEYNHVMFAHYILELDEQTQTENKNKASLESWKNRGFMKS